MSKRRETLWLAECDRAHRAGRGQLPICNLCNVQIAIGESWDESHFPIARTFGGKASGIAHRKCNRDHGSRVVVPAKAKADRLRRRHIGAAGPGLGRNPLPAGKRSRVSRTIRNGVQLRQTQAEKHRAMMARRYGDFA